MDERLNYAPCGYLSLADDGTILTINQTMLDTLGYDSHVLSGKHINSILTVPAQLFYQIYFFPMIKLQNKVEEMHLTLKSKTGQEIPMLVNAIRKNREQEKVNECIFTSMNRRFKFEHELLQAKKTAEEANRVKHEAIGELNLLRKDLEQKQTELLELNAQLLILASTDELTGLKNRRSFQEGLAFHLAECARSSQPLSLLLLDVDHFKTINDTFGHAKGDLVLQKLARILLRECCEKDIAFRYGGEEFTVILPNRSKAEAITAAERIRLAVEKANWAEVSVTISIGVATASSGDTVSSLQSNADVALYASKHAGRNQVTHSSEINANGG